MSNDDYIVDPLSNSDVREHARRLRRFLKLADARKREQTTFIARFSDLNSGLSPFTCDRQSWSTAGLGPTDPDALKAHFSNALEVFVLHYKRRFSETKDTATSDVDNDGSNTSSA